MDKFIAEWNKRESKEEEKIVEEKHEGNKEMMDCPICMLPFKPIDFCCKQICLSCQKMNLSDSLAKVDGIPICCPNGTCKKLLKIKDLKFLSSKDEWRKLVYFSVRKKLETDYKGKYQFCPKPSCASICIVYQNQEKFSESQFFLDCPICVRTYCLKCGKENHPGRSCDDFEKEKKLLGDLKLLGIKRCPSSNCNAFIEKNGGCKHMTCFKCHIHFCWQCMKAFTNANDTYEHINLDHNGELF